jgi:hypothetical protein
MISIQHAGSLATLHDVTRLTSAENKNEYNKTGRSGVCEGSEVGEGGGALLPLNLIYPAVVPKLNCMNILPQMPLFLVTVLHFTG